jgi:hypothetical protein
MTKVRFEGFNFGEKTLENVYFIAEVNNKHIVTSVTIAPDSDNEYWNGLNRKYWLNEASQYLQELLDQYGELKDLIENDEVVVV